MQPSGLRLRTQEGGSGIRDQGLVFRSQGSLLSTQVSGLELRTQNSGLRTQNSVLFTSRCLSLPQGSLPMGLFLWLCPLLALEGRDKWWQACLESENLGIHWAVPSSLHDQ
jgi:hypothetical protein